MIFDQVKCDVCGRIKGETNHWLVAITYVDYTGILFVPADDAAEPRALTSVYEDICGQACAVKRFSQWLETLTPLVPKGTAE